MTTPRGRVSFGHHAFPFSGIRPQGLDPLPLPLVPIKVRGIAGEWSHPFNAILDTGSTRTLLPAEFAGRYGLRLTDEQVKVTGVGGVCEATAAAADIALVDANLPDITCWEIQQVTLWILGNERLGYPILGWDILRLFEVTLDHRRQSIAMRLNRP